MYILFFLLRKTYNNGVQSTMESWSFNSMPPFIAKRYIKFELNYACEIKWGIRFHGSLASEYLKLEEKS